MNLESRLEIVNKHIKKLERCVIASEEQKVSPQLQQLRQLREEIKSKAKKDFLQVQSEVLDGFRTLMEKLTTLSFFASEAEQDNREIEKAISQMNKIKSTISEGILGLKEEKEGENKATASAEEASVEDDARKYVEQANGKYFTVYQEWFDECKNRGLQLDIEGDTVSALNDNEDCLGRFSTDDMEGCLFENIEDYDRAFDEYDKEAEEAEDEEAEEIDEDAIEEEENA